MKVQTGDTSQLSTPTEYIPKFIELQTITNEWCTQYCNYNLEYTQKVENELAKFKRVRVMNADGNCFYRAILIGIMEKINSNIDEYLPKYTNLAKLYYEDLLSKGYPEITVSDFYEIFIEILTNIPCAPSNGNSSSDSNANIFMSTPMDNYINKVMQDNEMMNYSFVFMRLVVSCYLQNNAAVYQCYLTDGETVESFCKNHVEPIEIYCDNIQIDALVNVFYVNTNILSITPNNCYSVNTPANSSEIDLHLLYNSSHYNILYK